MTKLADRIQGQCGEIRSDLLERLRAVEREFAEEIDEARTTILEGFDPLVVSAEPPVDPVPPAPVPPIPPKPATDNRWLLILLLGAVIGWGFGQWQHSVPTPGPVPPIPGPGPDPTPGPTPDPVPVVKYPGSWVLVIEETEELSPDWAIMKADAAYWDGLKARTLNWRYYDDDSPAAAPYLDRARAVGIPAVLILSNTGRVLAVHKRPSTNDELDAIVKKATGL